MLFLCFLSSSLPLKYGIQMKSCICAPLLSPSRGCWCIFPLAGIFQEPTGTVGRDAHGDGSRALVLPWGCSCRASVQAVGEQETCLCQLLKGAMTVLTANGSSVTNCMAQLGTDCWERAREMHSANPFVEWCRSCICLEAWGWNCFHIICNDA